MLHRRVVVVLAALVAPLALASCCLCDICFGNFNRFECRSKQSEAKSNLRAVVVAEQSFFAEHNRYGTFEEIGFSPQGGSEEGLRYIYTLQSHDETSYLAQATGRGEMKGDIWVVDEKGVPRASANVCGGPSEETPPAEQRPGAVEAGYRAAF